MDQYYIEYVSTHCDIPKSKLRYYEKKNILKILKETPTISASIQTMILK